MNKIKRKKVNFGHEADWLKLEPRAPGKFITQLTGVYTIYTPVFSFDVLALPWQPTITITYIHTYIHTNIHTYNVGAAAGSL